MFFLHDAEDLSGWQTDHAEPHKVEPQRRGEHEFTNVSTRRFGAKMEGRMTLICGHGRSGSFVHGMLSVGKVEHEWRLSFIGPSCSVLLCRGVLADEMRNSTRLCSHYWGQLIDAGVPAIAEEGSSLNDVVRTNERVVGQIVVWCINPYREVQHRHINTRMAFGSPLKSSVTFDFLACFDQPPWRYQHIPRLQ
jgi:hypothetical protein